MLALERACFGADARTRLLLLSQPQCDAYLADYPHAAARITVLPPTIDMRHHGSSPPSASRRSAARERRGLPLTATIWLWIGIQPDVKGLDRVIAAIEVRPEATLLVCGLPAGERAPAAGRAKVMGVVSDEELSDLFEAADLLIHPARLDVTGSVILEAMAHGLPVITTANCGFSTHVAAADAGVVLPVPFGAPALLRALDGAAAERRESWAQHAYAYCNDPNLYSGIARACDEIEAAAERR
jgi:UDP-glucose:(heptosyl)LPS alpha-1,3-glucosyltransferase